MARTFNGSTQYLSGSSTLLTNEPIDFVGYFNADIITANMTVVGVGDTAGANGVFGIQARGDVASDPVRGVKSNDTGTASAADTTAGFAASTWYVASATFISDTSRAAFLNGANKGTSAASVSDPTPNAISVGALLRSTATSFFDGSIAEVYALDANMSDAQHALAGAGISPIWFMPLANIRAWYPLQADNNNRIRNGYPDLSATASPTSTMHPAKVIYPRINGVICG